MAREGTGKTPEDQKEGNKPSEKGNDREETVATIPWQREGGWLSRLPSAQRVYNVTSGPQASGAASDNKDAANTAEQQTRGHARTGLTTITPDRTNQHCEVVRTLGSRALSISSVVRAPTSPRARAHLGGTWDSPQIFQ